MKKKVILMLAASLLVSAGLAGCGGREKAADDGREADASTQTDDGEQEDGQAGTLDTEEDNGNVLLTFWCGADELAPYQELIDKFIAEYKGEANITVETADVPAATCKDVFLGDVTNGADVFVMPDDQLRTMVASGVLEEVANAGEISSRNLEGSVEAASVDGKLYTYPVSADNGYFLYYDKRYFKDSDVQTLDKILEICEENGKKFVMDWTSGWYLYAFFGNTGLELAMNEDGLTNSCNWNTTEGEIKGTDIAQSLLDISSSPAFLSSDFLAALQEGDMIAGVSGVWSVNDVEKAFGKDYGACKLPTYTCAGKQVQMASFKGYRLIGVNSYSAHRGWAEKLADYITNEESQKLRFERGQSGPSNINAAASDEILQVPAIAAVQEQAEYGKLQVIAQKYWTPMENFGKTMIEKNPNGMALQDIMDQLVSGITG